MGDRLPPEDDRLRRLKQVVAKEFDVEILHKWREIRILEDELEKGEQLKTLLEKLILNEHVYAGNMERSSSFAISQPVSRASTPGLSSGLGTVPSSPTHSSGRRLRNASIQAQSRTETIFNQEKTPSEPGPLYEMCPDGSVVRLRCPVCGADKFRNVLGMTNHCRINCGIQITNPDDRIQQCGVPVALEEVPPEFFLSKSSANMKRDRELAQIRAGVQGPIVDPHRRPMIREFSETDTRTVVEPKAASDLTIRLQLPTSLASHQADVETLKSRFYIRKRVIIGNYARNLDTDLTEAEAEAQQVPTHEWRLYLRPFDAHDDVSRYIKAVRFHLHPSYAPNDVILVDEAPFELRMTGWGEFPARLEVIFVDPKNKPVEFVHFMRLFGCKSRGFSLMSEQAYDIELDKKSMGVDVVVPATESSTSQPRQYGVDDALAMASRFFPLFGALPKQHPPGAAQYNRAVSYAEYMKLSQFDQQALEKERALALQRHLSTDHPTLTLEYVLDWCRRNGLTPVSIGSTIDPTDSGPEEEDGLGDKEVRITEEDLVSLQYCRYCGLAHFPQEKFEVLQKNCSMRPRKLHLSSRSTASDLVSAFSLANEPFPEAKKPKIMEASSPVHEPPVTLEEQWVDQTVSSLDLSCYQPRQDTCQAIVGASRKFLADLMARSVAKLPDTIERAVGRPAIITPLHLYQTITGITPVSATVPKDKAEEMAATATALASAEPNRFDFLSNSYMAGT